ncbi:MAG: hypothetical protein HC842_04240, partial [Cytophagales bacterium]|nr:hypothetical protein [Cytophagales bacterium]
ERMLTGQQTANHDSLVKFIFHNVPTISMSGSFVDMNACISQNKWPESWHVVEQGKSYGSVKFKVMETHAGQQCPVREGLVIVKNDAATKALDTLTFDNNGVLQTYSFVAGQPMPVYPYLKGMTAEFWSGTKDKIEDAEFMADNTSFIAVEGEVKADGADIIVTSDYYDEANLPLFVLRDPPGDKSYSYVKRGTEIKKTFDFEGINVDSWFIKQWAGIPIPFISTTIDQEYEHNESDIKAKYSSFSASMTITEELNTLQDPLLSTNEKGYVMGDRADMIVGLGVALKYGVVNKIQIDKSNTCQVADFFDL